MLENVKADLRRLSPSGKSSLRTVAAGLLSQGFQALLVYRFFNWLHRRGLPGQPLRFLCERFIEITTGISIPACCRIGKGFRIHHFGGIIFHPTARIGENCTLYHGVTIGDRGGSGGAAWIGDNVLIGAGAKIIGELRIGDNSIIGANTVVTRDVPPNSVAVGSPCRVKDRTDLESPNPPPRPPSNVIRIMDLRGTYKGGGGPDKTILNSAAQHDPSRVFVQVTYLRQPDDDEFQIPAMAERLGIPYLEVVDRKGIDFECLRRLREIVREKGLTLIHAHDDKTLLYGWLLKLSAPGVEIMYTCHSHAAHGRDEFKSLGAFLRFKARQRVQIFLMKRYAKPIVTVSLDTRNRLLANGLGKGEVAVLYNGIDIEKWRPGGGTPVLRRELGIADDVVLVGTVARITYEKDLPTFYAVARAVAREFPKVAFVVVGDGYGNELDEARRAVRGEGLENLVRFTGHRNDLLDVYASFDLFLMTSLTEGLPNTLLEAMAMGLPAVSTAVGGIPELVEEGISGLLAPAGGVEELTRHVLALLGDEEKRRTLGGAARARIEARFDFARRVRLTEDLYEAFAAGGPGGKCGGNPIWGVDFSA